MRNRYLSVILFLIGLLFFVPSIVKASSFSLSVSDTYFDYLDNSNFWIVKDYADETISSSSVFTSYVITISTSSNTYFIYFSNVSSFNTSISSSQFQFRGQNGSSQRQDKYLVSTSTFSKGTLTGGSPVFAINKTSRSVSNNILYSNVPLNFSSSDTYTFTYLSNSYTLSNSLFPTLYDLYKDKYPDFSPPPSDNFPILTSFYNLVITKLAFITDYICSSYVLLSIFVILIFYFVILLFRRLR